MWGNVQPHYFQCGLQIPFWLLRVSTVSVVLSLVVVWVRPVKTGLSHPAPLKRECLGSLIRHPVQVGLTLWFVSSDQRPKCDVIHNERLQQGKKALDLVTDGIIMLGSPIGTDTFTREYYRKTMPKIHADIRGLLHTIARVPHAPCLLG